MQDENDEDANGMITEKNRTTPPQALALALIVGGRAALEAWFYRSNFGFTVSFGDDVMRVLTAYAWMRAPSAWPHPSMLPLQFYLLGLGLKLWANAHLAALIVQSAASWAGLLCLWLLSRELFAEDRWIAILAVAAAAFHPADVLFSLGSMQIPYLDLSVLAGAYFLVRHRRDGRDSSLWAASLCFSAAAMVHYDGWLYAALFSGIAVHQPRANGRSRAGAAAVLAPWILVLIWIAHLWSVNSSLLKVAAEQGALRAVHPISEGLFEVFYEFVVRFPLVAALSAASLWTMRARRIGIPWIIWILSAGELLLMIPLHLAHVVNPFCHYTHLWTNHLLLLPLAAWGGVALLKRWKQPLAFAGVLSVAAFNLSRFNSISALVSNFGSGIVKTAAVVETLWNSGRLSDNDRVLVEIYENDTEYGGLIWEIPLFFLIRPPDRSPYERNWDPPLPADRIVFDRAWSYRGRLGGIQIDRGANPSLFDAPAAAAGRRLERDGIKLAILHTANAFAKAGATMREVASFPPYRIFAVRSDERLADAAAAEAARVSSAGMPWRASFTPR